MRCDFHTHTLHSDGSLTPAQLVAEAKQKNLMVALTDHNTVAGLPEFLEAAQRQNVTVIPGVEFSTMHGNNELHLLGLFVKSEHYDRIEEMTQELHRLKEASNVDLVNRLNAAGYEIDYAKVKQRNLSGNVNRAHIASEMMEKGYVTSVKEALHTLLADGAGFYTRPPRLDFLETVKFLKEIKAVSVLAHPLLDLDETTLRTLLPVAIDAGLMGMETQHESFNEEKTALAKEIAAEFGLLESGGSDFHGTVKPGVRLGEGRGNVSVPGSTYDHLLQAYQSLQTQE